jgi:uncharacterized protein (DUF2147 family)
MKRQQRLACAALLISLSARAADPPPPIFDEWWTPGFNARVRIERCADRLCGTIVWTWDEQPKNIADTEPLVGRRIIVDMRADGPARWKGGRIYNPEDGRHYDAALTLSSANNLLVEGCVAFFCRSQVWRRVDAARCPPAAP